MLTDHLAWGGRLFLGVVVFLNALHRILFRAGHNDGRDQRRIVDSCRAAAGASCCCGCARTRQERMPIRGCKWLRAASWLLIAAVIASLVSGYVGFAAFPGRSFC